MPERDEARPPCSCRQSLTLMRPGQANASPTHARNRRLWQHCHKSLTEGYRNAAPGRAGGPAIPRWCWLCGPIVTPPETGMRLSAPGSPAVALMPHTPRGTAGQRRAGAGLNGPRAPAAGRARSCGPSGELCEGARRHNPPGNRPRAPCAGPSGVAISNERHGCTGPAAPFPSGRGRALWQGAAGGTCPVSARA